MGWESEMFNVAFYCVGEEHMLLAVFFMRQMYMVALLGGRRDKGSVFHKEIASCVMTQMIGDLPPEHPPPEMKFRLSCPSAP